MKRDLILFSWTDKAFISLNFHAVNIYQFIDILFFLRENSYVMYKIKRIL